MIRPGMIGFGGKRSGFYPNAVRFFTKSKWSHCFVVINQVFGEVSVIEADLKVQVVPFHREYVEKNADYYEVWEPIAATDSDVLRATSSVYLQDAGKIYGFLQIPWFAFRAVMRFFGVELRRNWYRDGEICSELLWNYLMQLGPKYKNAFSVFTEDECSPEDLYDIVLIRPDLFQLVTKRD
mgnify:FL=1